MGYPLAGAALARHVAEPGLRARIEVVVEVE